MHLRSRVKRWYGTERETWIGGRLVVRRLDYCYDRLLWLRFQIYEDSNTRKVGWRKWLVSLGEERVFRDSCVVECTSCTCRLSCQPEPLRWASFLVLDFQSINEWNLGKARGKRLGGLSYPVEPVLVVVKLWQKVRMMQSEVQSWNARWRLHVLSTLDVELVHGTSINGRGLPRTVLWDASRTTKRMQEDVDAQHLLPQD